MPRWPDNQLEATSDILSCIVAVSVIAWENRIIYRKATDNLYHIKLYQVHLVIDGIWTQNVNGDRHWLHMQLSIQLPYHHDDPSDNA